MASRVCWNCDVKAHQAPQGDAVESKNHQRFFLAFRCDECGALSIAEEDVGTLPTSKSTVKNYMLQSTRLTWHPVSALGKDFPDVPAHIAAAANEAHICHSVNAHRAAILMARAVVEATAKDKGITSGTLANKIETLHAQGHVRELVKETADEIRFMGNDMAHGDFVTDVDGVDSADMLAFMDEVLDEVYQAPARVNARKAERSARKAATKQTNV